MIPSLLEAWSFVAPAVRRVPPGDVLRVAAALGAPAFVVASTYRTQVPRGWRISAAVAGSAGAAVIAGDLLEHAGEFQAGPRFSWAVVPPPWWACCLAAFIGFLPGREVAERARGQIAFLAAALAEFSGVSVGGHLWRTRWSLSFAGALVVAGAIGLMVSYALARDADGLVHP